MASSFLTESEAPRDFRVSSTESDGHYTKCLLCYTVKRNFYCTECIRSGNFIHSSMPYSDRYSEKQAKLLRMKANRKYILDRCEKLLLPKIKMDSLLTEAKQSRDRLDLLQLAIEQRRSNIEEKRRELNEIKRYNNELRLKLPRYQKRVTTLGKHVQHQNLELQNKISCYHEKAEMLAALRRSRIRQLTNYIFPVYMTYDTSDSIEDMEFIGSDTEEEPPKRPRLHIVAPWINIDGDISHVQAWIRQNKDAGAGTGAGTEAGAGAWRCACAAVALSAQLVALLAWTLDQRLPHALALSEFINWRVCSSVMSCRLARVSACAAAVCAPQLGALAARHDHPLAALLALATAAATDHPALARVGCGCGAEGGAWAARWEAAPLPDDAEPEHLHWPDHMEEVSGTPPSGGAPPAPSLVTSAAASLASMWRGWTK